MAKIGLPKGSGKQLKVSEKSVKSQGILKWILSGNPAVSMGYLLNHLMNCDQTCIETLMEGGEEFISFGDQGSHKP